MFLLTNPPIEMDTVVKIILALRSWSRQSPSNDGRWRCLLRLQSSKALGVVKHCSLHCCSLPFLREDSSPLSLRHLEVSKRLQFNVFFALNSRVVIFYPEFPAQSKVILQQIVKTDEHSVINLIYLYACKNRRMFHRRENYCFLCDFIQRCFLKQLYVVVQGEIIVFDVPGDVGSRMRTSQLGDEAIASRIVSGEVFGGGSCNPS